MRIYYVGISAQETHLTKIDGPLIDRVLYVYNSIYMYTLSDLIPSLCTKSLRIYPRTSYASCAYERVQIRRRRSRLEGWIILLLYMYTHLYVYLFITKCITYLYTIVRWTKSERRRRCNGYYYREKHTHTNILSRTQTYYIIMYYPYVILVI